MSYIGTQPTPQSLESRQEFTATASQTTFATNGYTVGYVDVYLNGVKLSTSDFTATNGSDVVLGSGAAAGDVLAVVMKNDHSDLVALPITDSDGNNVLSESGNVVTLTADEANVGSNALVVDANGNVGIGASTLENKFNVNVSGALNAHESGTLPPGITIFSNQTGNDTGTALTFKDQPGDQGVAGIASFRLPENGGYNRDLRFYVNNNPHMDGFNEAVRITDTGNVHIGNSSLPTATNNVIAANLLAQGKTLVVSGPIWSAPSIPANKQVQADRWRFGGFHMPYSNNANTSYSKLIVELPNGGPSGRNNLEIAEIGFNFGWTIGYVMVEVYQTYYLNSGYKKYLFHSGYNPDFTLYENYGRNDISLNVLTEGTFAVGTTSTPQNTHDNSYYRKTIRASYGAYWGGHIIITVPSYYYLTDSGSEVNGSLVIRLLNPQ